MNQKALHNKIAIAVASAVVLPLMIVIYLMSRWATQSLDNPGTIIVLVLLALLLLAGGLVVLVAVEKELEAAAIPSGEDRGPAAARQSGAEEG